MGKFQSMGDSCGGFLLGEFLSLEDSYGEFLSMEDSCGGFLWGNSRLWGIPVEDSYRKIPVYGGFLSMGDSCLWGIPVYGGFLCRHVLLLDSNLKQNEAFER